MSPNMYAKVIKRPEPDTLPPDHLPGVGEATIPDKLRKIAANCRLQGFLKTADALDAAADEWEKDREQLDAMTVCRDHWEVSYKDVRKRLEAAEKVRDALLREEYERLRQGWLGGGLRPFEEWKVIRQADYSALAGEEKPCDHTWMPAYATARQAWMCGKCGARTEVSP